MTAQLDTIRKALADGLGPAAYEVGTEEDLSDKFPDHYDSLAAVEFVSAIESAFGFEVDYVGDDVRHWFSTLGRVDSYVSRRLEDAETLT